MTNGVVRQILWPVMMAIVALVIGLCAGLMSNSGDDDVTVAPPVGGARRARTRRSDQHGARHEIGQMMGWLQMFDAPLQNERLMSWMHGTDGHDHSGIVAVMPGFADGDELTAPHAATGTAVGILFLQLMIRHHQGGIDMAGHAS